MTLPDLPQVICAKCGRALNDHSLRHASGAWRSIPLCIPPGDIQKGIKHP